MAGTLSSEASKPLSPPHDGCWDVVVVGAGPAGSMAALEAARAGAAVLIVDMKSFPRFKVCGCCLNLRSLEMLQRAGLAETIRHLAGVPLERVLLASGGRRAQLALPGGMAVSRARLDTALVRAAEAEGATFVAGCRAEGIDVRDDACSIRLHGSTGSTRVDARVVVAADGLAGRLLDHAGGGAAEPAPDSRIGAACVMDECPAEYAAGTIHMACGTGGYVGLVRQETGQLNIAAAFDLRHGQSLGGFGPLAERILAEAGLPSVDGIADAHWRGTPRLTRRRRSAGTHRCLAVGDAAGYVEPFTGEGMAWAMETGRAAGARIAEDGGRFDASTVLTWNRTRARISAASERRCRMISMALRRPRLVRTAVAVLSVTPQLAAPVIRRLNRPSATPLHAEGERIA